MIRWFSYQNNFHWKWEEKKRPLDKVSCRYLFVRETIFDYDVMFGSATGILITADISGALVSRRQTKTCKKDFRLNKIRSMILLWWDQKSLCQWYNWQMYKIHIQLHLLELESKWRNFLVFIFIYSSILKRTTNFNVIRIEIVNVLVVCKWEKQINDWWRIIRRCIL